MFRDNLTANMQDYLRRQFAERGVGPQRLDLRQGHSRPGYLEVFGEIDISLDTFPCTGGVTTCESLWMGVPVVSLCGIRPAGRNSAALLTRVGLADWTVKSPEEYVALAVGWEGRLAALAAIRGIAGQSNSVTV